jgi:hypothetical protein
VTSDTIELGSYERALHVDGMLRLSVGWGGYVSWFGRLCQLVWEVRSVDLAGCVSWFGR